MCSHAAPSHPRRSRAEEPPESASLFLAAVARHARDRPGAAAVVTPESGVVLSYSALHGQAVALAGRIASLAAPDSTVVLAAPSGPEFVAWFVAGLRAGVRLLLVHARSPALEVAGFARRAGAGALIAPGAAISGADTGLARVPTGPGGPGDKPPAARCAGGAIVFPSSGTTGAPKLVLRETGALDADAINVAHATAIGPGDRVLAAMPLGHSYGVDITLAVLYAGATLIVPGRFDAPSVGAALEDGVTVFPGVPFMFEALARVGPRRRPSRLRLVFSAGAPLPSAVGGAFKDAWRVPVGQLYGATELGSVTLNDPSTPGFDPASVGGPFKGVSIRVLDPGDPRRTLAAGEEGHIAIAAPSMLSRYLDGEATLIDGHLLTGDLGRVDAAGRLFITGRLKLLIDVGGLKVNPQEVEAALATHPDVAECAVVPLPLSETVARLRAVYVIRAGETATAPAADELRRFLQERLAPHKVPRVFESVAALPRSPSGKLLRHVIANAP